MKRIMSVAVWVIMAAGLSGCFTSCSTSAHDGSRPCKDLQPGMDAAMAEIDSVKNLHNEASRYELLMAIAQRPGLSPQGRAHLSKSITMLSNESSRFEVLMALAKNVPLMPQSQPPFVQPLPQPEPATVDPAIAEIDSVKILGTEGARENLLLMIAQRPGLSPQARQHLAKSAEILGTEAGREKVLTALAQNVPPMPHLQPQPSPEAPIAPAH